MTSIETDWTHRPAGATPCRVQMRRTKGFRLPPNTRKVDRTTRWGNPFNATQVGVTYVHHGTPIPIVPLRTAPSLDRCLDMYQAWLRGMLACDEGFLEPLRGMNLACWCPLDQPCHADILLRVANDTEVPV